MFSPGINADGIILLKLPSASDRLLVVWCRAGLILAADTGTVCDEHKVIAQLSEA